MSVLWLCVHCSHFRTLQYLMHKKILGKFCASLLNILSTFLSLIKSFPFSYSKRRICVTLRSMQKCPIQLDQARLRRYFFLDILNINSVKIKRANFGKKLISSSKKWTRFCPLKKWDHHCRLECYRFLQCRKQYTFSSFQTNIKNFTTNECEQCPSSIRC